MKDYRISNVKTDEGNGIACGPIAGPSLAELKATSGDESFYLLLADVDGIPNFYKTPESCLDKAMAEEEDSEFWDRMNSDWFIETGDYDKIFATKDPEFFELYRYLIYLVREFPTVAAKFIEETEGKLLSEITIPKSDVEEEAEEA